MNQTNVPALVGFTSSKPHACYRANLAAWERGVTVYVLLTKQGFAIVDDLDTYSGPRGAVVHVADPATAADWLAQRPYLAGMAERIERAIGGVPPDTTPAPLSE